MQETLIHETHIEERLPETVKPSLGPRPWRNPSRAVRVLAVTALWALPGAIAGKLLGLAIGGSEPELFLITGLALGAIAGGLLEWLE